MSHEFIKKFEVAVFYVLSAIIVLYIAVELIELIYQFGKALLTMNDTTTRLLITKEQTAMVLPVFFNILIAVELIDTFNVYIKEHSIKVQSILLIGLIAIGRKLLVLDIGHADGLSNIGIASIIVALSLGYYLVKKK
ncbi:phosphate-starvation-inducible PsiE family protein [Penaeicola halotolerans]|uniref:phosphate-starvation-inducible PsiE family protein n=1 Tax=Penaeicola halotolerans TaxID=2793196 RepID=UPI001CF8F8BF|nr:phosphate-starvation-inducible PsiE family protein [Penaeicola halotolerans]